MGLTESEIQSVTRGGISGQAAWRGQQTFSPRTSVWLRSLCSRGLLYLAWPLLSGLHQATQQSHQHGAGLENPESWLGVETWEQPPAHCQQRWWPRWEGNAAPTDRRPLVSGLCAMPAHQPELQEAWWGHEDIQRWKRSWRPRWVLPTRRTGKPHVRGAPQGGWQRWALSACSHPTTTPSWGLKAPGHDLLNDWLAAKWCSNGVDP